MKKIFLLIIFLSFLLLIYFVSFRQSLLFIVGLGYGIILARAGFGFTSGWRILIERSDVTGMAAQFLLILVLFLLSAPVIVYFPQISSADASISYSLILGSFIFGLFMQLADGCGSGTLYKSGGLKKLNLLVFLGFIMGAYWGSVDIPYWLSWGIVFPAFNFIRDGTVGGWNVGLWGEGVLLLGSFFFLLRWFQIRRSQVTKKALPTMRARALFKGAIGLAILAWLNLIIAGQPWGIVYGMGLWGAKLSQSLGYSVTDTLYWQSGYNLQSLRQSLILDPVSMTNIGLLLGAFYISLKNPKSHPDNSSPANQENTAAYPITMRWVKVIAVIFIGVVLGYSSRLAFGCNIGAFVSGISTGSLHGWVWLVMAFVGSIFGVRLRRSRAIRYLHS